MRKIILLSIFLIIGLIGSQILPITIPEDLFAQFETVSRGLMFICLAFIMINVGREFELEKPKWRTYLSDYLIAMATAALPWILVSLYYIFLLPEGSISNWNAWKETLLIGRFAAPTSAGILFTMLAAAGLRQVWIYKKTQILAIFDDLDTILLMIPLQIMLIGMKWQLFVIVFVIFFLLYIGWTKLSTFQGGQKWWMIIFWAAAIVGTSEIIYYTSKQLFGIEGSIHLEVLLPSFVLGMVMKHNHEHIPTLTEVRVTDTISYVFMLLVGLSTPLFIQTPSISIESIQTSITASQAMMSPSLIAWHVFVVTILSNLGKLFPLFFYRDRDIRERLALSVGMFTRGEVGAGILVIALGYNLGGPILIISILSLVLNLILTGFFVVFVKKMAISVYGTEALEKITVEEVTTEKV